jgi:opine dehydrogenase
MKLDDGTFLLDTEGRFFTDDIPYGVLIARWVGQELGVDTPFIDEIIEWAGSLRCEKFLKDGKIDLDYCLTANTGIPPAYGITDVRDILD